MFRFLFCNIILSITIVGFLAQAEYSPLAIYGKDHRKDIYELDRPELRDLAASTAAFVAKHRLQKNNKGQWSYYAETLKQSRNLCSSEAFAQQITASHCSGFLVAEDIVATAGHCIPSEAYCPEMQIVFGYKMQTARHLSSISDDKVYTCKEVIARDMTLTNQDYALIRLDRPVKDRKPLKLQAQAPVVGDELFVIGHPSGLPAKYADGAQVRSVQSRFFVANLDTFLGSSGSAVFSARTLAVVGILVRGGDDYELNERRQCNEAIRCLDEDCRGEDVSLISDVVDVLQQK